MQRTNIFRGMGIALVTPFKPNGSIDWEALEALAAAQINSGADFLCVLGTTAETPCLSSEEKAEVMQRVKRVAAGRVPLLLGCGGNNTRAVCDYLRTADLTGFSGVLIVCPYYNKPSQEGLYRHFRAVAEASPLPIVLYNVPGRTGVNLEADTTLRIAAASKKVVAIKEASGRVEQISHIIRQAPDGFEVLSGDDALTLDLMQRGGVGVISVIGNAYPRGYSDMVHAAAAGDYTTAKQINTALQDMYKLMMVDGNPAGIKALLSAQHRINDELRLPLVPARVETHDKISEARRKLVGAVADF